MRALVIRLLLLIPMIGMILGCASTTAVPSSGSAFIPGQGWVPQQEVYNLEKVIAENGPASWVQELDNGYTEAAWITRKSRSRVFLKVMTFDREKRFISSRKKVASPMRMGRSYSKIKSSTPNVERGAATGAVAGGILGAVIGHNTKGKKTAEGVAIGALGGAVLGGAFKAQDELVIASLGGTLRKDALGRVVEINLTGKPIKDADLKTIAQQQHLQKLWLSNTGVTDAGLIHLKSLKQLRVLGLARTNVTDVGIKHLGDINSLRAVYLFPNKVGDKVVEDLKAKLPGIKIFY